MDLGSSIHGATATCGICCVMGERKKEPRVYVSNACCVLPSSQRFTGKSFISSMNNMRLPQLFL